MALFTCNYLLTDCLRLPSCGRFYVLARSDSQSLSYNHVYSIGSLLNIMKLPATVQLIIGPKPRTFEPRSTQATVKGKTRAVIGELNGIDSSCVDGDMFTAVLRLEEIRVSILADREFQDH